MSSQMPLQGKEGGRGIRVEGIEGFRDVMPPALRMEEGTTSKGMWVVSRSGKM